MLSDVYMRLGDLNLYNECYNESYAEYRECLAIRQRVCSADDRSVMEANFIAGMAKLYGGDRDTALAHFRSAAEGCKLRIAREQEKGGDAGTPFQQILKDIEERIEEEETAVGAVNMSAFRMCVFVCRGGFETWRAAGFSFGELPREVERFHIRGSESFVAAGVRGNPHLQGSSRRCTCRRGSARL